MNERTIAVVSSSRADYAHLYWPLMEMQAQSNIDLKLLVTGAHLSPEFGSTIDVIERDGFEVHDTVECLLSSDSDIGMAKTIGVATLGFADVLGRLRPDVLLVIADRYEMLAPASAALALRIPVAHMEGGEASEGAIDHMVRNALTMMSHVHFAPTKKAAAKIIQMGEETWRVHCVGAPSLDHLSRTELLSRGAVEQKLGIDLGRPTIIATLHPVTIHRETTKHIEAFFDALADANMPVIFCYPNADAGSRSIVSHVESFCKRHHNAKLFINLDRHTYWSLLSHAALMCGNSSSGIMESPSLSLPAVNVGPRQQGRERAANIIDVQLNRHAILDGIERAMDTSFRERARGVTNPYGDGDASKKIAQVLATIDINEELLMKHAQPVE